MIIEVLILNAAQVAWVEDKNLNSENRAIICDYKDINGVEYNDCIDAVVLTLTGYEDWAAYFSGATVTSIEIKSPF